MTSVAVVPTRPTAVAVSQSQPEFPSMSFTDMVAMGDQLVRTGFLPDHIKNGAQAAAIVLAGRELGMPVMRSLRSIVMVKGKITESADSQLARFKSDGGHAKFLELTQATARLWLRHPNGDEHVEEFTVQDAQRAGLISQGGMYQKYAKNMLRSRAITNGLKSLGWEGGAGLYDPSEFTPPADPVDPRTPMTDETRNALVTAMDASVFTPEEREKVGRLKTEAKGIAALAWAEEQTAVRVVSDGAEAEPLPSDEMPQEVDATARESVQRRLAARRAAKAPEAVDESVDGEVANG